MSDQQANPADKKNPYVGPRAFVQGEKLYGRDLDTYKLANLLSAQRIVLLHSPSGAGKTSLIRAALWPELIERGFKPRAIVRVNREPTKTVNFSYNRYLYSMLTTLEEAFPEAQQMKEEDLLHMSLEEYLKLRPAPNEKAYEVFIFDQFEEILTLDPTDQAKKGEFFAWVGELLNSRNRWGVFSMREDYIAALDPYLYHLPTRLATRFRLDLLTVDSARQAILEPATESKVQFAPEAADLLLNDLSQVQVQHPDGRIDRLPGPYIEPVQLQVVCRRLWDLPRTNPDIIDESLVSGAANVDSALAQYYDSGVAQAAKETGIRELRIREWVETWLITKQGIRGQVLKGTKESEGMPNAAIGELEKLHLVRTEGRGGGYWLELSHDRLVKPVQASNKTWFSANLTMLERQAAIWKDNRTETTLLLTGDALHKAEEWSKIHYADMSPAEKEFLLASQNFRTDQEKARAAQEAAIKLEEQKLLAGKLRLRAVWLGVALTVALVLLVVAYLAGMQAQISAKEALIQADIAKTAQSVASANEEIAQQNQVVAQENAVKAINAKATADIALETSTAAEAAARAQALNASKAQKEADIARARAEKAALEADRQRKAALFNSLISSAFSDMDYRPDLALLLSVEAYTISPTMKAKNALLSVLQHNTSQAISPFPRTIPQQYSTIRSLAFHPSQDMLSWATYSDTTDMWNLSKQEFVWEKMFLSKATAEAFSPNGKILAVAGLNPDIYLVNPENGSVIQRLSSQVLSMVLGLAFSPNGRYLAAVGSSSLIVIWDTSDFTKAPLKLNSHENISLRGLAWSPDSAYLAVGGNKSIVWVWDIANQGVVNRIELSLLSVNTLAWSGSGTWLAVGGAGDVNKNIAVWNSITREITIIPNISREIATLAFSPDSRVLAVGGYNQLINFLDTRNFLPISLPVAADSVITSIAFSPGYPKLVAWGTGNANIQIYQLNDQQPFYQYLPGLGGAVQSIQYLADQAIQVTVNIYNYIRVYAVNLQDGVSELVYKPSEDAMAISLLSAPNNLLVRINRDGVVRVGGYQPAATEQIFKIFDQLKIKGTVTTAAISPNGQILAVSVCTEKDQVTGECTQNGIALFNLADGQPASAEGVWDSLPQGKEFPQYQKGFIGSLAFDPSGNYLFSGAHDNSIVTWNIALGDSDILPLNGHLFPVTSLAVSPDRTLLASGDMNGNIILWDRATGSPVGEPFLGQVRKVTSLAFSPDGSQLVSGYESGDLAIWDINVESWIQRACSLAGRALFPDEWLEYLGGEPYNPRCQP